MRYHVVPVKGLLVCVCLALLAGAPAARTGAIAADPDDGAWDSQFGTLGTNGPVFAIAVSGNLIYVGGRFTMAGGVRANSIAVFNTTTDTWSALGTNTQGGGVQADDDVGTATVAAIAIDGANVFVGGDFVTADGTAAASIARWNGASWSALGSGITDADLVGGSFTPVTAIAASGGNVYVGGTFDSVNNGGVAANFIARWNGTTWSALGSGLGSIEGTSAAPVTSIDINGSGDLYVTGAFQTAGGSAANHVAKFTVSGSTWAALGSGVANGFPLVVKVGATAVYVGGTFTTAGGGAANRIAQFTGDPGTGTWAELGGGANGAVRALDINAGVVLAGGDFTVIGGSGASGYAQFSGAWSGAVGLLGMGTAPASVAAVANGPDGVYVGGAFGASGTDNVTNVAVYSAGLFAALKPGDGQGLNGPVFAVARHGFGVIATGDFLAAGGTSAAGIARWNGSSWTALGTGLDGIGRALAVNGNDVYVGGSFSNAGGVTVNGVARWNGTSWSALGSGPGFSVSAIAVDGNTVYAGGNSSGTTVKVAQWNGSAWTEIATGTGSPYPFGIVTMTVAGDELFVGGEFTLIGGTGADGIAKWSDGAWTAVATNIIGGFSGVYAIAVNGGDIFIGGSFTSVDGVAANNVARKTGTQWFALGSGITRSAGPVSVNALAIHGDNLFVGGMFSHAGGGAAASIAVWDGSAWAPLDAGVHAPLVPFVPDAIEEEFAIRSMALNGDSLFVGGDLIDADGSPSLYFGRWGFSDLGPNLLCNGDFSAALTCWFTHEPGVIVHNGAANGVFEYYRASGGQAVVFNESGDALGSGTALLARFDIGNTRNVRQRISVLILNSPSFSDLSVCTFWLPPNAPLRTYEMRTHTTQAWSNAGIYFYSATVDSNGDGRLLVDNVSLHVDSSGSDARTDCIDPLAPAAPGGASSGTLLDNGDFTASVDPPNPGNNWTTFGNIVYQQNGGVFEYYRVPPTDPAAVVIQTTTQALNAGDLLTATFQLGNSSSVRKRVTVLLHSSDFQDLSACTFWLPPGQLLSDYEMRAYATQAWTAAPFGVTISIYAATVGTESFIRLDNVTLEVTPSLGTVGTECIEPGGGTITTALTQSAFSVVGGGKVGTPPGANDEPRRRVDVGRRAPTEPARRLADPGAPTTTSDDLLDTLDDGAADWIASGGFMLHPDADVGGTGLGWQVSASSGAIETLQWLRTIDLTSSPAELTFWSWLSANSSAGALQVSVDGMTWETVGTASASDGWALMRADLSAYQGHLVHVRFAFAPAPGVNDDVWRIDDITIRRAGR